ncbi:phosphopantetheine-binding protein [Labedaea rhizosphaerae]|uniref:Phosphopantetheine binding protein n=1 Tax=Labedaea rhizosphaerae TaxID=598644 RepID=A0A4R6S1W1_LABRH|nr:phosphopantetheine-binding protein [Labedaea rhizosphaerae]TDP92977.1 phosphopantetheine binding protein [Labedaea rhizosphaerae]
MVSPSEISEVLSAHPGVTRAEAAVVRHEGREVTVAAVELSEYLSGPVLRNHVRERLGEDNGLAGVLVTDAIPTTGGALDVDELAAAVADGRCTLFEDPRDEVERRVAQIWSAQMAVPAVGVTDDFLELGGDSLSALGIIAAIETEFDRSIDVFEFMNAASVRRLAELLR